ncbi:hypothetical protein E2C01_071805 [Portunus trituberculatus]|uniref:Uncharacterized protein n=1 Tax=Portunus trituberculatus TaxID=210409 RepID=A0A5B7I4W2_PORTR|nr:hypothetical protein [Portunus trituberculatus]
MVYTSVLHRPCPAMFLFVSVGDSIIAGHRLLHPAPVPPPAAGDPPPCLCAGRGGPGWVWGGTGGAGRGGGAVYTILAVLSRPPPAPADGLMNLHSLDENYCHCPVWATAPERGANPPLVRDPGIGPSWTRPYCPPDDGRAGQEHALAPLPRGAADLLALTRRAILRFMSKTKQDHGELVSVGRVAFWLGNGNEAVTFRNAVLTTPRISARPVTNAGERTRNVELQERTKGAWEAPPRRPVLLSAR